MTNPEVRYFAGFSITELTRQNGLVTAELTIKPNTTIPEHHHKKREKAYYVLEGACCIYVDGNCFGRDAGQSVEIPPGAEHKIVTYKGARILVAYTHPDDNAVWRNEKPTTVRHW